MTPGYVRVCEDVDEEPIELPLEEDSTLLLSTVAAQFPGVSGLKFQIDDCFRGIKLSEGRLYPNDGDWDKRPYYCVFPKVENKRKCNDSPSSTQVKTKRIESTLCVDLIVLGLPWSLTEDEMRNYFQTFGTVKLSTIKRDAGSGHSKGYGFVRFDDYSVQMKVLAKRHHINGRWCDVKIPDSREGMDKFAPCKIFVGRLGDDVTAEDLKTYFTQFGQVTDVYVPNPFRSFAFVTFDSPEVAKSLIGGSHVIKGSAAQVSEASRRESQYQKAIKMRHYSSYSGYDPNWATKSQSSVDAGTAAIISALAANPVLAAVNQLGMSYPNKSQGGAAAAGKTHRYGYDQTDSSYSYHH